MPLFCIEMESMWYIEDDYCKTTSSMVVKVSCDQKKILTTLALTLKSVFERSNTKQVCIKIILKCDYQSH